jgi:tetratricopeptide (TPR) repeat protein
LYANQLDEAATAFEEISKHSGQPQDQWFAAYMLGLLCLRRGHSENAEEWFTKANQTLPNRIEPKIRLAEIKKTSGNLEAGIALLNQALKLPMTSDPGYFEPDGYSYGARLLLAEMLIESGAKEAAAEHIKELTDARRLPDEAKQRLDQLATQVASNVEVASSTKPTPSAVSNQASPRRPVLTIGMATHDDFHGTYFTVMSVLLYHKEVHDRIEILVVDNNPDSEDGDAVRKFCERVPLTRYVAAAEYTGTAIRERVFAEALGEFVLCMDCHVFLHQRSLARFLNYIAEHPDSKDLFHGPLAYDNGISFSSHMDKKWNEGFYGVWGTDARANDFDGDPFEIPLHGMGMFACRRSAWPGFNPRFRGFGGEEGYMQEKFRQLGRKVLCLPFLRWTHRFERPGGPKYVNRWEDRIRNYLIGWDELGQDTSQVLEHFLNKLPAQTVADCNANFVAERSGPLWGFDVIYCIARTDSEWQQAQTLFAKLEIDRIVRRLSDKTESVRIVEEARQQNRPSVLLFDAGQLLDQRFEDVLDWCKSLTQTQDSWCSLKGPHHGSASTANFSAIHLGPAGYKEFLEIITLEPATETVTTYVIGYWLDPDSPPHRAEELRKYFDLQIYSKQQFGAQQIIVTNIDYEGAMPLRVPEGFKPEHAMFAKYLAVQQVIEENREFPICLHDHDLFIKRPLRVSSNHIVSSQTEAHAFSDQLVVFPSQAASAINTVCERLKNFNLPFQHRVGYGCEQRHERRFSTEVTLARTQPYPFTGIPIDAHLECANLVGQKIREQHSLDPGHCEAAAIPPTADAVHGHLNKGPVTDSLVDWLVSE